MSGIQADYSGAMKKTQGLLNLPKATRKNLESFGAETVRKLKESARARHKRHTSALFRSPGMKLQTTEDFFKLYVGTGVGSGASTAKKYARIQDKGGIVTPKRAKYLTVPFPGVKGVARDYPDSYVIKLRGHLYIVKDKFGKRGGGKYVGAYKGLQFLFALKKKVTIPGTAWFTAVWEHRLSFLKQNYLNDKKILETAQRMAGGGNA